MHVGGVAVFQPASAGFDYDRLVKLIKERITFVPRYRQRVKWVPGKLANPVWVDDEHFDVTFHVRRSALPKPGTRAQLREFVGRIMGRPLDRNRPLWEMYLVEGLEDGQFAIITKTHHAMVDGVAAVDIGQVILDASSEPRDLSVEPWRPRRSPSAAELVAGAVVDTLKSPASVVEGVRNGLSDINKTLSTVGRQASGLFSAALTVARPVASSPLNVEIGEQRRYGTAAMSLEDFKLIRRVHGGTVNDVVLAVVTGALRAWLMTRGESVGNRSTIRAMVPVSVRGEEDLAVGNQVAAFLVDLPVGEPDPIMRLSRISYEMGQHKESGQMIGAQSLVTLADFASPTLHSLGARLGSSLSKRVYNLVVTNVPGPQFPLYAAGAQLMEAYPVVPLAKGQAVSVGLTSYNGGVFFGLNADRDAMPDIDVVSQCLLDSIEELKVTAKPRTAAGNTRSSPSNPVAKDGHKSRNRKS